MKYQLDVNGGRGFRLNVGNVALAAVGGTERVSSRRPLSANLSTRPLRHEQVDVIDELFIRLGAEMMLA
jgi:hypothetical protein